ncbi:nucleoside monophosphate kinase [Candidatus Parcubacteria bacterium]|nr:nucleoside monophosphate kinase [Candidatus Parcubacteria bacterium]
MILFRDAEAIVLFGPPNSGKGTIGSKLKNTHQSLVKLSTGDLCRQKRKEDPQFDLEFGHVMEAGELLPDDVTLKVFIESWHKLPLEQVPIIDGLPRTLEQCFSMRTLFEERRIHRVITLFVNTSRPVCECRARKRGREDDSQIKRRLDLYDEHSPHIQKFLWAYTELIEICGDPSENIVWSSVQEALELNSVPCV